jgi:glycosyltransferase involved in cell wall biosynthesis
MIKILHITPHLGGGVGRVLLNYLAQVHPRGAELHSIASLEYANAASLQRAAGLGIRLEERMSERLPALLQMMAQADVVLIHWWNHPLLYALLVNESFPPVRLLIWSHVAGLFPTQNLTDALVGFPDRFVIATPHSLKAPALQRLGEDERAARIRLVFSCAGIDHVAHVVPRPHEGFRVGYVGTVDYCKMHPDFIRICAAVEIPGVRFVVCGGPNESAIRAEAQRAGVAERFEFLGQLPEVDDMLASFDVFGYPLAPYHYGTGEQALIEALAAGVPPVVLSNGAEQLVVEDGVTGIVAGDPEAYARALELLYREPQRRLTLAQNARRSARERFTIEGLVQAWSALYAELLQTPRRTRKWGGPAPRGSAADGAELYLASLGEHGGDYAESRNATPQGGIPAADRRIARKEGLFRAKTRGTVFHYRQFFPDDPYLNLWCGLMLAFEGLPEEAERHFISAQHELVEGRVAPHLRALEQQVPIHDP